MKSKGLLSVVAVVMGILLLAEGAYGGAIYKFQEGVWNGLDGSATSYDVQDCWTYAGGGANDQNLRIRRKVSGWYMPNFRFDLTAAAYQGSITNPSLTLRVNGIGDAGTGDPGTHYVYALPADNTSWLETTATGDVQTTGISWQLDVGGDAADNYTAATSGLLIGTKVIATMPAVGDLMVYDLDAAAVNQWLLNPAGYAGFAIVQPGNVSSSRRLSATWWDSSEATTAAYRPLLQMEIPEPATMGLLALGGLGVLLRRRRRREA